MRSANQLAEALHSSTSKEKPKLPEPSPRAWKSAPNTGYGTLYTIKRRNVNLFAMKYFRRRKIGFLARLAQVSEVYGLINLDRDDGNFSSNEQWSIGPNRPRNQLNRDLPCAYLLRRCITPDHDLATISGDSVPKTSGDQSRCTNACGPDLALAER